MNCPKCKGGTHITDSRHWSAHSVVRRRRECKKCGERFTTFETRDVPKRIPKRKRPRKRKRREPRTLVDMILENPDIVEEEIVLTQDEMDVMSGLDKRVDEKLDKKSWKRTFNFYRRD